MKNTASPLFLDAVLGQKSKLAVLRLLYRSGAGLSGREIARQTRLSHQTALSTLADLSQHGILGRNAVPPAYQYSLNRNHWMVREILLPAFQKEAGWLDGLLKEIADGCPRTVVSLILYGSLAAGDFGPSSDVDVLALVKDPSEKAHAEDFFAQRCADLKDSYHHPVSVLVYDIGAFRELYRQKNKFAAGIAKTGRVLSGKLLTEVLFGNGA